RRRGPELWITRPHMVGNSWELWIEFQAETVAVCVLWVRPRETPLAVTRRSRNSTPMTVSCTCSPASSSAMTRWTNSQVICVRRILTSRIHLTVAPQALHNAGRLAWGSGPRGEKPNYTGLDVIIVRDDKIAALYVFLDSMPS